MREAIKSIIYVICKALVSPLAIPVRLLERWDRQENLFQFASQFMSIFPGIPGEYLRRAFYIWVLDCLTPGPTIGFGTIFAQRNTAIGKNVYIGPFCNIGSSAIGDDVLIGSNVSIASPRIHGIDSLDVPIRLQDGKVEKISIGNGSWIGNGAIILSDVGAECVIGAGTVVAKACEQNGIYVGNTARLVRFRSNSKQ
ncbi:acyltransferase [Bythopirellula goksoeyrii]|uniref:Acetyltransferase n=1 Tax=Bythopirellula goksoeyrii TaxID=1400387 RepID=A0A5B9QEW0_9BACT|nr:acyltransferase [Bythopirellula goksoeyrii]QEG36042.1 Putative acetyltransferase [Bythopirellula goksoeyrii]